MYPAVQMLLRNGLMIAHKFAAIDHLEDAWRHVEQWMSVRITGFKQKGSHPSRTSKLGCRHTTGGTATHNDIVVVLGHDAWSRIEPRRFQSN